MALAAGARRTALQVGNGCSHLGIDGVGDPAQPSIFDRAGAAGTRRAGAVGEGCFALHAALAATGAIDPLRRLTEPEFRTAASP
jgi:hypothetical protein